MKRRVVAAGAIAGFVLVAGACSVLNGPFKPAPAPEPCGQVFNGVRCTAIRDSVAQQLQTTREDVVGIDILPGPTPEVTNGGIILHTTSGGGSIDLRVTLADGSRHDATISCAGIPEDPGCFDDPELRAWSPTQGGGGYSDVPEGASPVPTPAIDALHAARELRIERRDIPIDHLGPTEVQLGEVLLPNGRLRAADFALVDAWPSGVTILEGGVGLEVRSMVDGKLITNVYEHGWHEGAERAEVVLVFDVFRYDPGATLGIRDVLVR